MKHLLALALIPALSVSALAIDGRSRTAVPVDSVTGSETVKGRPDPIPDYPGMVFVPAGNFLMGSTTADLYHAADVDEWPQHSVWVDDFYIDVHEVTNAQYKVFLDSMHVEPPPRWVGGNYGIGEDGIPVAQVTWTNAAAYARFVGKRLPTEAEWEKAARGTDARRYPWGNRFDTHRCNNGDSPLPIMSFPGGVSPYGCFDMAGNVAEWVADRYTAYPRARTDVLPRDIRDRNKLFHDNRRVYRGGSWNSFGKFLRCANREAAKPNTRWAYVGFRCARDAPWSHRSRRDKQ